MKKTLIIITVVVLGLGYYFGYFYWAIGISAIMIISNIIISNRIGGSVRIITKAFIKRLNDDLSIIDNVKNGDFTKLTEMTISVVQTFMEVNLKHYYLTQENKDYLIEIVSIALSHKNMEDYLEYVIVYTLILYYSIKDHKDISVIDKDFGSQIISELINKTLNKYFTVPYPNLAKIAFKHK